MVSQLQEENFELQLRTVSTPINAAITRPVLIAVLVLLECFGAGAGVELEPEPAGDPVVDSGVLITGGRAGSTTSAILRRGTGGAAPGGFAATGLLNMSPGLTGSIV